MSRERTLSVHTEHEFLLRLEQAGMTEDDVQLVIGSRKNKLAKDFLVWLRNGDKITREVAPAKAPAGKVPLLEYLSSLFETQVNRLVALGYPALAKMTEDKFVSCLASLKVKLGKIGPVQYGEGRLPFVIIAPHEMISIAEQLGKITYKEDTGMTTLHESWIACAVAIPYPDKPFLAVDVEDGRAMLGKSPSTCEKQFEQERRLGLIVEGGIALEHQSQVLSHHCLDLPGSLYSFYGEDVMPNLSLTGRGPELDIGFDPDRNCPAWGSASCREYIGA